MEAKVKPLSKEEREAKKKKIDMNEFHAYIGVPAEDTLELKQKKETFKPLKK